MVAIQNLTVYQGADYKAAMELRDESAALINLTDYDFRGQAKVSYTDASPAFEFQFTLRDQTSEPGMVDLAIPAASTSALSLTKETMYLYDIEMEDADGIVRRLVQGKIKLYPEVTK